MHDLGQDISFLKHIFSSVAGTVYLPTLSFAHIFLMPSQSNRMFHGGIMPNVLHVLFHLILVMTL